MSTLLWLSLSTILRLIHIGACISSVFLVVAMWCCLNTPVYVKPYLCSWTPGLLQVLSLMNKAAIDILFSVVFVWFFFFWVHWVLIAACRLFSSCGEWGLLFVAVRGLLIAVASLVAEHGLSSCGMRALEHAGFSSCGAQAQ